MSSMWCFQCGAEYNEEVLECVECGVPTTSAEPTLPEDVGSEDEEQLAYELHEWSGEGRRVLDGMLTTSEVAHSWQGATLIVRDADESKVDDAVRQAELATMPTLDSEQESMVYELDQYNDEHRTRLVERLGLAGIPHEFDAAGDLVVHESDEEAIDEIFETLTDEPEEAYVFGDGVDGVDPHNVISDMFLAVNKLRRNAGDSRNMMDFATASELAEELALPFGFSGADWREILDETGDLRGALFADEVDDDDIKERIDTVYTRLRPLV